MPTKRKRSLVPPNERMPGGGRPSYPYVQYLLLELEIEMSLAKYTCLQICQNFVFAFAPILSAILMISGILKYEKAYFVLLMLILFSCWKYWLHSLENLTHKISHPCKLGDKDCRNEGKSPMSRFTISGFQGNIFFVIFIKDAIFQFCQGFFFFFWGGGGLSAHLSVLFIISLTSCPLNYIKYAIPPRFYCNILLKCYMVTSAQWI